MLTARRPSSTESIPLIGTRFALHRHRLLRGTRGCCLHGGLCAMGCLPISIALLYAVVGTTPIRHVAVDQVEVIEYNHFYDEHGRHVFDQLLFYDWSPRDNRYQIRDWR